MSSIGALITFGAWISDGLSCALTNELNKIADIMPAHTNKMFFIVGFVSKRKAFGRGEA
jgi:hypothetical protein